jgi:hypothetical protein
MVLVRILMISFESVLYNIIIIIVTVTKKLFSIYKVLL